MTGARQTYYLIVRFIEYSKYQKKKDIHHNEPFPYHQAGFPIPLLCIYVKNKTKTDIRSFLKTIEPKVIKTNKKKEKDRIKIKLGDRQKQKGVEMVLFSTFGVLALIRARGDVLRFSAERKLFLHHKHTILDHIYRPFVINVQEQILSLPPLSSVFAVVHVTLINKPLFPSHTRNGRVYNPVVFNIMLSKNPNKERTKKNSAVSI